MPTNYHASAIFLSRYTKKNEDRTPALKELVHRHFHNKVIKIDVKRVS